ncbi:hypothetical protein PM082_022270 [Marasmius tenuissimus]|nr:hypothetical protein PM082_022270 [Marasmius tenuissimus]
MLLKLDESTGGLMASLESVWSRNGPGTPGLSADTMGTARIETICQLRIELGSFLKTTETIIDQFISVCDCALLAMEEGGIGYLVPSIDRLWSKPTGGESFRTTNGPSPTLREAIQHVHDEMELLFGEVEGRMVALKELSRTTRNIRRSIDDSQPTSPLIPIPNDADKMKKALTDRCIQTENMAALAIIALQSFERRLRIVLEPAESQGEVFYIDARSVRSGLEKMKEVRRELNEGRGIQSVENSGSGVRLP